MSARRPWRSTGAEVIGWWDGCMLLPKLLQQLGAQPRAFPYYVPRRSGAHTRMPPLAPPPGGSDWIVEAERAISHAGPATMSHVWRRHSLRTWHFAAALAARENRGFPARRDPHQGLDDELMYVAALLHDSGLFLTPRAGESFAAAGARLALETAEATGADENRAQLVATAIESHISVDPGNQLGDYIQFGSLLDLTAAGIWKLDRALVEQVYATETRLGFPSDAHDRWLAECQRLPLGRAAYAKCPGALLLATRLAPLPHRTS